MKKLKASIDIGAIFLTFVLSLATGVAKDFVLTRLKNLKKPVVSQTYHNHSQAYHNHQGKTKKKMSSKKNEKRPASPAFP